VIARTILYVSLVYIAGNVLLTFTSIPPPEAQVSFLGHFVCLDPIIDSALWSLLFFVVDSVCHVAPSVCLSRCSFKSILLLCFSTESSHFWPSSFRVALYKTMFFDFWFTPANAQNLLPKIGTVGLWDSQSIWTCVIAAYRTNCAHKDLHVGRADPCCHGNDIWAGRGVHRLPTCLCITFSFGFHSFTFWTQNRVITCLCSEWNAYSWSRLIN